MKAAKGRGNCATKSFVAIFFLKRGEGVRDAVLLRVFQRSSGFVWPTSRWLQGGCQEREEENDVQHTDAVVCPCVCVCVCVDEFFLFLLPKASSGGVNMSRRNEKREREGTRARQ